MLSNSNETQKDIKHYLMQKNRVIITEKKNYQGRIDK